MKRARFRALVEEALAELPQEFRERLDNVAIMIEDRPSAEEMASVGAEDRYELLGLYLGVPQTERDSGYHMVLPDRIVLYQKNIEDVCESDEEVRQEVKLTVAHEIAHHFGISDEELDRLGLG